MTREKILIVDDNESLLSTLSLFLGQNDFEVVTASNVDQALAALGASRFDFLIIDLAVGDRGGEEILRFLGISLLPPPKKVIAVTANPGSIEQNDVRTMIDTVLTKPFSLEELLRTLAA